MTDKPSEEMIMEAKKLYCEMLDELNQSLMDEDMESLMRDIRILHEVPHGPLFLKGLSSNFVDYMEKRGIIIFEPKKKKVDFKGLIDCMGSQSTEMLRMKTKVNNSWNAINAVLAIPPASGDDARKRKRPTRTDVQNGKKKKTVMLPLISYNTESDALQKRVLTEEELKDEDYPVVPQFHKNIQSFEDLKSERIKSSKSPRLVNQYFSFNGLLVHKTKVLNGKSGRYSWAYVSDAESSIIKITFFNDVAQRYEDMKVGLHYRFTNFYCRNIQDEFQNYDVIQNKKLDIKPSNYYQSPITQKDSLGYPMLDDKSIDVGQVCDAQIDTMVSLSDCLVIHSHVNPVDLESDKKSFSFVLADSEEKFVRICVVVYEGMEFSPVDAVGSVVDVRYGRVVHNEQGAIRVEIYSTIKTLDIEDSHWSIRVDLDSISAKYEESLSEYLEINSVKCCSDQKYGRRKLKFRAIIKSFGTIDEQTIYEGCNNEKCKYRKMKKIGKKLCCDCNPKRKFGADKKCMKYDLSVKLASDDSEEMFFDLSQRAVEKLLEEDGLPNNVKELRKQLKPWEKESFIAYVTCSKGQGCVQDLEIIDSSDQE